MVVILSPIAKVVWNSTGKMLMKEPRKEQAEERSRQSLLSWWPEHCTNQLMCYSLMFF